MPMVPWGKILNRKIFYAVVLCFVASLGVCKSIHNEAYSGPEWNQFKEFQIVRSQLIDYRGLVYLKDRPDIHEKYGYSVNDLDMLRRWFFADQEVANTSKLQSMLDELGPLYDQGSKLSRIKKALTAFLKKEVIFFLMICLLTLVFRFKYSLLLSWCVFIAFICYLAVIGRPGVLRVYLPVMSLLCLMPFFIHPQIIELKEKAKKWRKMLLSCLVLVVFGYFVGLVVESLDRSVVAQEHRVALNDLPEGETLVMAPYSYHSNYLYPVLGGQGFNKKLRLEVFGWSYFMPTSVASVESRRDNSFTQRLFSKEGVLYREYSFSRYIATYCKERGLEPIISGVDGELVDDERLKGKNLRIKCI